MISVQNVEKRYGEIKAVSEVSFTVQAGEIVGLLGHNGAGKTTIMKVMTGYLEPTNGTIKIDGLDVIEDRIAAQKKMGYLPENAPLYLEMQVQEYLDFIASLRGLKPREREEAIERALASTGLTSHRHQVIQTLSKGYRQRVGLAQAILHQPKILILDEPTNGLDPVQILEIRALIKRLAQHTTIILSTHILSEIEAVCDRVMILIDGYLVEDRSLEELLDQTTLRLRVKNADQVEKTLCAIEGVKEVRELERVTGETERVQTERVQTERVQTERVQTERADGFVSYLIDVDPEKNVTPTLVKIGVQSGWEIGEITTNTQSLEGVFRNLMDRHIEQAQDVDKIDDIQELS